MKKIELYNIGKSQYKLPEFLISQIIMKNSKLTKNELFLLDEIIEFERIINDFNRYQSGEPIEYILNLSEFFGLDFYVDSRVLIPRNDTEIMVFEALKILKNSKFDLIDVGTGSSSIAISIAKNTNNLNKIFVIDISQKALEVSKINIKKHNLESKITQLHSDLLSTLESKDLSQNIIITANLPYIKNSDYDNMSESVIEFEPSLALYGGEKTGFELYEKLINQILEYKKTIFFQKNIVLFIEIGFDQFDYSKNYLNNLGLKIDYFKDNCGINRCVKIEF